MRSDESDLCQPKCTHSTNRIRTNPSELHALRNEAFSERCRIESIKPYDTHHKCACNASRVIVCVCVLHYLQAMQVYYYVDYMAACAHARTRTHTQTRARCAGAFAMLIERENLLIVLHYAD